MPEPAVFRSSRWSIVVSFGVLLWITSAIPTVLFTTIHHGKPGELYFDLAWIAGLVCGWVWVVARVAFRIRILPSGEAQFRTVARTICCPLAEISSITGTLGGQMLQVRHRTGTVTVLRPISAEDAFIAQVDNANPAVSVQFTTWKTLFD